MESKISSLWSEATTWEELVLLNIDWLEGRIDGIHPSNYSRSDLDTTDSWTTFLKKVSAKSLMVTMDSQPGTCDLNYTSNEKYIESVNEKYSTFFSKNKKVRELQRPYVGGFVPIEIANQILSKSESKKYLVFSICLPKQKEAILRGGRYDKEDGFNLTKIIFQKERFQDLVTNISRGSSCTSTLDIPFSRKNPLRRFARDHVAFLTITTVQYCDADKFKNDVIRFLNELFL